MRFSDYQIARAVDANELQAKVRTALAAGWSPLGAPLFDGRNLMQALTLDLQPADEARMEAAKQLEGITADSAVEMLSTLQANAAAPAPANVPAVASAPAAKTSAKAVRS